MSSVKRIAPRERRTYRAANTARRRTGSARAAAEAKPKPPSAQELRVRLAHNVHRLRCARKLTVEQAADVAQIHPRHWHKVEDGEANATLRTLMLIAAALEVSVAELFRRPMRKGKR